MRLPRFLCRARGARPKQNFHKGFKSVKTVPLPLKCSKSPKPLGSPEVQIPKVLFGSASLPKAQKSSTSSLSQNPRGRVWCVGSMLSLAASAHMDTPAVALVLPSQSRRRVHSMACWLSALPNRPFPTKGPIDRAI